MPLDMIVHCLQELQTYYLNEIQRAMCGFGEYRLMKEFHHLQRPADECVGVPAHCFDDIVTDVVAKQEREPEVSKHCARYLYIHTHANKLRVRTWKLSIPQASRCKLPRQGRT